MSGFWGAFLGSFTAIATTVLVVSVSSPQGSGQDEVPLSHGMTVLQKADKLGRTTGISYVPVGVDANHERYAIQTRENMFYAAGAIGEQAVDFLVDTGAYYVCLSSETAEHISGLSTRSTTNIVTVSGATLEAKKVTIPSLRVAGITLTNVEGCILPETEPGKPAPNVLGMSFLSRTRFWYEKGQFMISQ